MVKTEKPPISPDGSKKKTKDNVPEINTETLCDDTWKCSVLFIKEGDEHGSSFVQILQQIPAKHLSGNYKVLNKSDLVKEIKRSGGKGSTKGTPKSQKGKEEIVPLTDEETVIKCIKENKDIPGKPFATVLKSYLFKLKVDDINGKMQSAKTAQKKKPTTKPKESKKEGTDANVVEENTEVAVVQTLVIMFLGFNEHDLPIELIRQDVPVESIVKIIAQDSKETNQLNEKNKTSVFDSNKFNMPWLTYWRKLGESFNIPENNDLVDDLAVMSFKVPGDLKNPSVSIKDKKNIAINQLGNIAEYVLSILKRFSLYKENTDVVAVADELAPESPDLYNTLIQMVPLECGSITVLLYAVIEQICLWNDADVNGKNNTENCTENDYNVEGEFDEQISSENDDKNSTTFSKKQIFTTDKTDFEKNNSNNDNKIYTSSSVHSKKLSLSSVNKEIHFDKPSSNVDGDIRRKRSSSFIKYKLTANQNLKRHPAIIRNNDEYSLRTFHLDIPEIDFSKLVDTFLSKTHLFRFWQDNNKSDHLQKYFMEFHLQRLWKLADINIPLNLFNIYFHWYLLCKMKSYFIWDLRNMNLSAGDILQINNTLSISDNKLFNDWKKEYINNEKLDHLANADNTFDPCVKSQWWQDPAKPRQSIAADNISVNSKLDPSSLDFQFGQHSISFMSYKTVHQLHNARITNLAILKKFLSSNEVACLQEHATSPRIKNCMKLFAGYTYIEEMRSASILQAIQEAYMNYSLVRTLCYFPSDKIVLWFYNSKDFVLEELKTGAINSLLGLHDYYDFVVQPEEELLLNENNVDETNEEENKKKPSQTEAEFDQEIYSNDSSEQNENKLVYDISKKFVKFNQCTRRYFSDDGSTVTVNIEERYRSSKLLYICLHKIDVTMNIYVDMLNSVDNNHFSEGYKNENFKVSLEFPNETLLNVKVEEIIRASGNVNEQLQSEFVYSDLIITLPTGLVIEVIKNSFENDDLYIKQSYNTKGPNCNKIWDEKCRCFLKTGAVLVFKHDDTIDIMYSNSTTCRINKIEKFIQDDLLEEVVPEVVDTSGQKSSPQQKSKTEKKRKKKSEQVVEIVEPAEEKVLPLPYRVVEHSIKTWDGKSYTFKEGLCINVTDNKVDLRTIFKPYKQLYVDRNDGIKSFFNEEGGLILNFNDGTMLSTYMCTEPDINVSDPILSNTDNLSSPSSRSSRISESDPAALSEDFDTKFQSFEFEEKVIIDERFISCSLGFVAEHPNYAKVEFVPNDNKIVLTLPQNLVITLNNIKNNGSYNFTVNVNKKSDLEFSNNFISFKSYILKNMKNSNITWILPLLAVNTNEENSQYFCQTNDSFNNLFMVNIDGVVNFTKVAEATANNSDLDPSNDVEFYFENRVPKKMEERFFVVNRDFSGYEFINEDDIELLEKIYASRFKNFEVVNNPTNKRILSNSKQYLVHKTHSDLYMMKQNIRFADMIPTTFQKMNLKIPSGPWLFARPESRKANFENISFANVPRQNRKMILAVVVKTVQKVSDSDEFNAIEIISNCLEKYKSENEKLHNKYKQQSISECSDARLRESHELSLSIRNKDPLWNMLRKECPSCKQTFGHPTKRPSSPEDDEPPVGSYPEKTEVIEYFDK